MKTPLGREVDLGPVHLVLDGVPATAKGAQQPPSFGPSLLWARSRVSATAELLLLFIVLYCIALVLLPYIGHTACVTNKLLHYQIAIL